MILSTTPSLVDKGYEKFNEATQIFVQAEDWTDGFKAVASIPVGSILCALAIVELVARAILTPFILLVELFMHLGSTDRTEEKDAEFFQSVQNLSYTFKGSLLAIGLLLVKPLMTSIEDGE